jgi:thiamine biosynthesis lipoprotein
VTSSQFNALGTTAVVAVENTCSLPAAERLLRAELDAVDAACSRFRHGSELSRANTGAGARRRIGGLLVEAVATALRAAADTDGIVTPTVGESVAALGYDRTFQVVRARDSWTVRDRAHAAPDWRDVELDVEGRTLFLPRGVRLDLGATAKAFAADRAAATIAARVGPALVSLGGDVAVAGQPPAGGWVVAIADDHRAAPSPSVPAVSLSAGGLATSSTTVRRWRTNEGDAHHIVDPHTSRPAATPWRTVSVTAATCVDANVGALAALVLGAAGPAWLEQRGLHARLVAGDGGVVRVGAWPADRAAA